MQSLKRKTMLWEDAKRSAERDRQRAAAARTGQVARSTVDVYGEPTQLDQMLEEASDTAALTSAQEDAIFVLDEDQASGLDYFLDGDGTDIEDVLDVGELGMENVESDVDRWEEQADAFNEVHAADMRRIEAEQQLNEAREEIDGKLVDLGADMENAGERLQDAEERLTTSEGKLAGMVGDLDQAVSDAAEAQVEASLAKGLLTVMGRAPVVADGEGKPVGAVWMHRDGVAVTALFEWTALGWVPRPLAETIIPKVAIGAGTYGELDGVRLKAKSILADKVAISSGQNEAWDGNYTAWDTPAWGGVPQGGPGSAWTAEVVRPGMTISQKLTERTAPASTAAMYSTMRAGINIPAGQHVDRALYVGNRVGEQLTAYSHWFVDRVPPTGLLRIATQVYFYNAAGNSIGNLEAGRIERVAVKPGEWMRAGGTKVTVPPDAVAAIVRPTVYYANNTTAVNGAVYYLGGEEMYWANAGELLVDGSVKSQHVATGALEAIAATITSAWIRNGHIMDLDVSKLIVTGSAALSEAVIEKLWADVVKAKFLTVTEKIITQDVLATNAIDGMTIRGVEMIGGEFRLLDTADGSQIWIRRGIGGKPELFTTDGTGLQTRLSNGRLETSKANQYIDLDIAQDLEASNQVAPAITVSSTRRVQMYDGESSRGLRILPKTGVTVDAYISQVGNNLVIANTVGGKKIVLSGSVQITGDKDLGTLPGVVASSLSVFTAEYEVRLGQVFIYLNLLGQIVQGAGMDVWSGLPASLRPPANRQAAAWLEGGYAGVAWVRPNGTVAVANRSGATRNSAQFTLTYPLP